MIVPPDATIRQDPTRTGNAPDRDGRRRRGATAMEYLFVISLILVVCISTIGQLGQETKQLSEKNSAAVEKALKK
jgi:Flp pilus assembly pilin Flp